MHLHSRSCVAYSCATVRSRSTAQLMGKHKAQVCWKHADIYTTMHPLSRPPAAAALVLGRSARCSARLAARHSSAPHQSQPRPIRAACKPASRTQRPCRPARPLVATWTCRRAPSTLTGPCWRAAARSCATRRRCPPSPAHPCPSPRSARVSGGICIRARRRVGCDVAPGG